MNTVIASVVLFVTIAIQGNLAKAVHKPLDVCDPCDGWARGVSNDTDSLKQSVRYNAHGALNYITMALNVAKGNFSVHNEINFNLKECCGRSYVVKESDLKFMSVHQLVVESMLNLNDAANVDKSLSYTTDALGSTRAVLCALQFLETKSFQASSPSDKCVIGSQMDVCRDNSYTCHIDKLFTFLLNADKINKYLIDSGRIMYN